MSKFINERPIVVFGILLALGVALGNVFLFNNALYIYAAIITVAAFILVVLKHLKVNMLIYCLAFCIGILSITVSESKIISVQNNFFTGIATCNVHVLSVTKDEKTSIVADGVTIDNKTYGGKVIIYLFGEAQFEIKPGQTIDLIAKIYKPKTMRNPNGFDYNFYLMQNGIAMSASADALTSKLIKEETLGLKSVFVEARESIEDQTDSLYGDNSGLVKAILLGDKIDVEENVLTSFRDSGLAHILAVSGLHIGFVVAFLLYLLRRLKLKYKNILIIITSVLLCYCAVTNFSPSIVRASIMAVLVLGAKVVGKRQDTLTSLFAAGIIILLFDPFALFKVGFQLSFCAVLGIIFMFDNFRKLFNVLPIPIKDTFAISLSAQSGIFLVSAYYFYNVTMYSLLANILVMPIIGLLVVLAFISVILGFISSFVVIPIVWIVNMLLSILTGVASFVSSLPFASVTIGQPPVYIIFTVLLVMYIISKYVVLPKYIKLVASLAITILILGNVIYFQCTEFSGLKIIVFDVGQGDSAYIETPGGYKILLDGGPASDSYDTGESVLLPYFYGSGINELDLVIASHAHSDHVGGLVSVAKELKIDRYLEPNNVLASDDDVAYYSLISVIKNKSILSTATSQGNVIELSDGVKIEVIYPDDEVRMDENERALVVKIIYNDFSMVFTADIGTDIESKIASSVGSVNVLKVAHHGSKYSTSDEFLNKTKPQTAIISVGTNSYGHPTQEVLDRLNSIGANVYRTDTQGAVIIKVYKNNYTVETMIN